MLDRRGLNQPNTWAHEFGHNRGLRHDTVDNLRIMYEFGLNSFAHGKTLTADECKALEGQ